MTRVPTQAWPTQAPLETAVKRPLAPSFGLFIAVLLAAAAAATAQPPGHGSHPPMPDQKFYLRCRLETETAPSLVEAPLELASPAMPAELNQTVSPPADLPPLRLLRYLPRAVLEQNVVPDDKNPAARPAVKLSIDGPTQSHQRWLVADDPKRNRLISFIGTWRYMAVDDKRQRDELFEQFRTELTRPPKLLITAPGAAEPVEMPAKPGTVRKLDKPKCTVRVREFFPHFGLNDKTKQPVNQSDRRLNPAALLEIEGRGGREERWVFAEFPDFKSDQESSLPLRITLDCPRDHDSAAPDFTLVTVGRTAHEFWTRPADEKGKARTEPLALNKRVEIAGSPYTFHLAKFIPAGLLVEQYHATQGRGAVSALQIQTKDAADQEVTVWLELGKQRVIPTAKGPMVLVFGPRPGGPVGGHK